MVTRNVKNHELSKSQTQIAQVVSSYTEPLGITDRKLLEQITNEAIRRLEGILPGMEHLVLPENKKPLLNAQIHMVVKQIMNEKASKGNQPIPEVVDKEVTESRIHDMKTSDSTKSKKEDHQK